MALPEQIPQDAFLDDELAMRMLAQPNQFQSFRGGGGAGLPDRMPVKVPSQMVEDAPPVQQVEIPQAPSAAQQKRPSDVGGQQKDAAAQGAGLTAAFTGNLPLAAAQLAVGLLQAKSAEEQARKQAEIAALQQQQGAIQTGAQQSQAALQSQLSAILSALR